MGCRELQSAKDPILAARKNPSPFVLQNYTSRNLQRFFQHGSDAVRAAILGSATRQADTPKARTVARRYCRQPKTNESETRPAKRTARPDRRGSQSEGMRRLSGRALPANRGL